MEIETWMAWYKEILQNFGFDRKSDEESAEYLNDYLKNQFINDNRNKKAIYFSDLPTKENIIVFGAGPSLKKHINQLKPKISANPDQFILISADGATTALIEDNIVPHIIVTDLDGKLEDILKANAQGAFLVVHGHGNNLDALKTNLNDLKNVLGTTQSYPLEYVHNFGGFTDGDRAVFLAVKLGAKNIIMAGMDFGEVVTKYSRPNMKDVTGPADDIKKLKLKYAERLVEWIGANEDVSIYNLVKKADF
ncbi:MAG: DUF115 domain-containing protein [Methanobacteriaceae archaeon]|jgi:uncharacterized Rossmann fold enzyme|nr:DUF115 domain-containing protein [Methanobacteriaceae archaeon]MDO9627573.1 DUF115 domain-containing protein [Methanobacteriaceae archaeon]